MKHIIIIGAGPGIGKAVAEKFGKEKFKIYLIARSENNLKELTTYLTAHDIICDYIAVNATEPLLLEKALRYIREKEGLPSMILYNAAAMTMKDITEQTWENIKKDMDASVGGFFHLMKYELPTLLDRNKGKVFVTGGGFAFQGDSQFTSLSMSKAALRNLVQAFQQRVENSNIHIAQLTICDFVKPESEKYNPQAIAEQFWLLYQQQAGSFQNEVIY